MPRTKAFAYGVGLCAVGAFTLATESVARGDSAADPDAEVQSVQFSERSWTEAKGQNDLDVRFGEELRRLDLLMDTIEELRFQLDRTQFDVEALSLALQPGGALAYVEYVTNQVYFEQYPGLLRGATGALMSRAGNALDQAVLLATLMSAVGYDVRIARTRLTASQAEQVLKQTRVERSPYAPPADREVTREILEELADLVGRSYELIDVIMDPGRSDPLQSPADTAIQASTREHAIRILDLLDEHGVLLGDPEFLARLRDEAKDYFWVEYRRTQVNPWRQAHPVFLEPPEWLTSLEAVEILDREVPDQLQHRFRFAVYAEQKWGNDQRTHTLMTPWEVPAANLAGRPQVFQLTPDSIPDAGSEEPFDWNQLADEMLFMFPRFGESVAPGGLAMDIRGNVADPEAAANPMAGVFATGARRIGEAAGALDSLGQVRTSDAEADAFVALNGVYLEYTLIAPGGAETVFRRDLLGPDVDPLFLLAELLRETTFMVLTGSLPDAFIIDVHLERILGLRETFRTMLRLAANEGPFSVPAAELAIDTRWLGHFMFSRLSDAKNGWSHQHTYRSAPGLVIYDTDVLDLSRGWQRIDIAANPRRPTVTGQPDELANIETVLRFGVWESHIEGVVIGAGGLGQAGAIGRIATALAAGETITVIHPFDIASSLSLDLPPSTLKAIGRDLDSGYAVIVPAASSDNGAGWWRIHPSSGNTLAMIDDGRGGQVKEYMTLKEGKALMKLLKTIQFSQRCLDGSLQNIVDAIAGFISIMFGDVGTYLRSVYGDDLEEAAQRMNACERTIFRMLVATVNRLP